MKTKKYYLETNALYSIAKIGETFIPNAYTSALAIFELVSGIKQEDYHKRKKILKNISDRKLTVDWRMPQQIMFESYNALKPHKLVDKRVPLLKKVMREVIATETMTNFIEKNNSTLLNLREIDNQFSKPYVAGVSQAQRNLKASLAKNDDQSFTINNRTYNLNSRTGIFNLLTTETYIPRCTAISQFVNIFTSKQIDGLTHDGIFSSYNGLMDQYINAFCVLSIYLFVNQGVAPKYNDFVDLLHLLYLEGVKDRIIVSDDKIFSKVWDNLVIGTNQLKTTC